MKRAEGVLAIVLVIFLALRWWPSGNGRQTPVVLEPLEVVAIDSQRSATAFTVGNGPPSDTLTVFTDFLCPFCRRLAAVLDTVGVDRAVLVRVHHWPIEELHPSAFEAARAFECAASLGKAKEMHDAMFLSPLLVEQQRWDSVARLARLESPVALHDCLTKGRFKDIVRRDQSFAQRSGFSGTPTLIYRGRRYQGLPTASNVRRMLEQDSPDNHLGTVRVTH